MRVLVYHTNAHEYRRLIRDRLPDLDVVAENHPGALHERIADADILIAWHFPLDALAKAGRLRWIQLTSAGVEHVLTAAELVPGIVVTNARGIHGEVMADYTFGAIVMLHWNFPRLYGNQQARRWEHQFTAALSGKTLGVIGLGAIGGEIARRGPAFGLRVVGVKRDAKPVDGVSRVFAPERLVEMLPLCDFVVLTVPGTAETLGMIGERELRAMKASAFLINIARGSVVNEDALVRSLRERWIAGAALDVFAREPLPEDHPLWRMDNVILTPHIAGEPAEYARRVVEIFADNYTRWTAGHPLRNTVDLARGY